jgi:1,2-diacylglycerol 3-alpha-glucosyltransferase
VTVVLLLASPYPAPRGSQLLVRQVEQGLRRRGHDVVVVSYGTRLRDRTGLHPLRPALDVVTLARALVAVHRTGADVLHAHNYEAGLIGLVVSRLLGVPLVFHGHSRMAAELPSYASSVPVRAALAAAGRWLDRTVPPRADHCVAVTSALAEDFRRGGARGVTVLRPVLDPAELRALGPCDPEATVPTVGYAGNLDRYQNLALLREAFGLVRAEMPEARLLIVTHAPAGAPGGLEDPSIDVVRAQTVAGAWRALGRPWVAAVPRTEPSGHPMKVLNYMAAGKAIVTTAGAAHGLQHDVDALVVSEPGPKAFASAILELLRDQRRRERLGAAARRAATSDAEWLATMTALEDVYRTVRRPRTAVARARPRRRRAER